jgi:hypothetical protein
LLATWLEIAELRLKSPHIGLHGARRTIAKEKSGRALHWQVLFLTFDYWAGLKSLFSGRYLHNQMAGELTD